MVNLLYFLHVSHVLMFLSSVLAFVPCYAVEGKIVHQGSEL